MTEPVATFDTLGFAYRPGAWVLRGLSGVMRRGETLAVLGPNGRGKTTFLKLLLGTLHPTEGAVRRHVQAAFTPQLFQVAFDYSALQMVVMGRARRLGWLGQPDHEDEAAALAALDRFGVADLARRPFSELSGGQRQLVILARAVVSEAELLVMDEPMSALDLKNQEVVLGWIAKLSRQDKMTIVFSTHQPAHALVVADRSLLMSKAGSIVMGETDAILSEENLRASYEVVLKSVKIEDGGRLRPGLIQIYDLI